MSDWDTKKDFVLATFARSDGIPQGRLIHDHVIANYVTAWAVNL